jgi:uncharacterized membrane protein
MANLLGFEAGAEEVRPGAKKMLRAARLGGFARICERARVERAGSHKLMIRASLKTAACIAQMNPGLD